jgi:hypothetical protein
LHAHVIDNNVAELDIRVVAGDFLGDMQEQPSAYFMMFALWTAVTSWRLFWRA